MYVYSNENCVLRKYVENMFKTFFKNAKRCRYCVKICIYIALGEINNGITDFEIQNILTITDYKYPYTRRKR